MFAPPHALTPVLIARSSPACMMSFFVTAFAKGDFAQAWAWSDDPENAKSKTGVSADDHHPNGAEKTASADATGATAGEPKKKLKKRK